MMTTWRKRNSMDTPFMRGRRIGAVIAAGVAMLALAALAPSIARAQTVTLSPISALNFTGQTHIVTAQVNETEAVGFTGNTG
jgi:hypothetical protein